MRLTKKEADMIERRRARTAKVDRLTKQMIPMVRGLTWAQANALVDAALRQAWEPDAGGENG